MEQLQEQLEALEARLARREAADARRERRLRAWQAATAVLALAAVLGLSSGRQPALAEPAPFFQRLARLERIVEQQHRVVRFFRPGTPAARAEDDETNLTFTGNLYIVNGQGATETANGSGNLIVGYGENSSGGPRTGSHNVVVGAEHAWTAAGGLVAGFRNAITGRFATITGGVTNTASGTAASVSGGDHNTASGDGSSVSGGSNNSASRSAASVSGGEGNTASGINASVSGGSRRTAGDLFNWAAGGLFQAN